MLLRKSFYLGRLVNTGNFFQATIVWLAWFLMLEGLFFSGSALAQVKAFPTAEGYGAEAKGGRGGKVIYVTNLNASGAGSFREACEASGPRIVVFRTGGVIDFGHEELIITNPYLTIAGQTAPGDGIMLKRVRINIQTHDVIMRHIRIRVGPNGEDCMQVGDLSNNVIIDHCSLSWAVDGTLDIKGQNVTVQNTIISEGLNHSTHSNNAEHSTGLGAGWKTCNYLTIYNVLFAHNSRRNPWVTAPRWALVNSVIYNWKLGAVRVSNPKDIVDVETADNTNIIGCYWRPGPQTPRGNTEIELRKGFGDGEVDNSCFPQIYVKDNFSELHPDRDWLVFHENQNDAWASEDMFRVREPIEPDKLPSVIRSPQEAFEYVLVNSGANKGWSASGTQNTRDAVDTRVVASVRDSGGQIIDGIEPGDPVCCVSQHYYPQGGWPEFKTGEPYADTDKDGIADNWETCAGVSDKNGHELDKDYTNLEVFLQEIAGDKCYTKCAQTRCDID